MAAPSWTAATGSAQRRFGGPKERKRRMPFSYGNPDSAIDGEKSLVLNTGIFNSISFKVVKARSLSNSLKHLPALASVSVGHAHAIP